MIIILILPTDTNGRWIDKVISYRIVDDIQSQRRKMGDEFRIGRAIEETQIHSQYGSVLFAFRIGERRIEQKGSDEMEGRDTTTGRNNNKDGIG